MNRKQNIFVSFLTFVLALMLAACGANGSDKVERFAKANPGSGANIAIPGYEKLDFAAGKTTQAVSFKNPPENPCTFALALTLEDGGTLWTGEPLSPGEAYTRISLSKPLDAGSYAATLHYDCYTIEDSQPLNGEEIQLTIEVR